MGEHERKQKGEGGVVWGRGSKGKWKGGYDLGIPFFQKKLTLARQKACFLPFYFDKRSFPT